MRYQLAVIGAGPGGYVAAIRGAQAGLSTICIEKRPTLGGTCLNVGCIPSKALLQSTEEFDRLVKHGKELGIDCASVTANFPRMMERKNGIVQGLTAGIAGLFKKNGVTYLTGNARFISPNQLEVGKEIIEADRFIIATGSESIQLPFLPFDEEKIVSSTGALALQKVPKKMVVVGAGVIGVELASVYRRLGSEVTVIEMLDRICPALDGAIGKLLQQSLEKQGITFQLSTEVTKAKLDAENADVVLVAVGRKPYTEGLNLGEIGVKTTAKGFITVDDQFRTSQPHIHAIGDVIEGVMLAHRASEEAIALVDLLTGHTPEIHYLAIPNVIYTYPEVATVGLTEKEARDANLEPLIGTFAFRNNARARCAGSDDGLVKVIGDSRSKRLIGLHIIGPHASELIGEGAVALSQGMTLSELAHTPHAHPTLTESIKEAALAALKQPLHS